MDSLTYGGGGTAPAGGHHAAAAGLQSLDVVRTSLHDALDSLLIHAAATGPATTPSAGVTPHSLAAAAAGCGVLNPIDKLYSMQTSYFSCAE